MGTEPPSGPSARFLELVASVQDLPMLPTVVGRVIALANDPESSTSELCAAIRTDPSLTARVLRVVNSPFYGFHRRITTVAQAAVILGTSEILALVLGSSAVQALKSSKGEAAGGEEFWRHSVCAAVASKVAALQFRYRVPGSAFVAGLLHDAGRLVMMRHSPGELDRALERSADGSVPLRRAEQEVFGADHALVGAALASRWQLPEELVQAIAFHHQPGRAAAEHLLLVDMVHLGDWLAHRHGTSDARAGAAPPAERDRPPAIDQETCRRLAAVRADFDDSYLDKLLYDLEGEMEHSQTLLGALGG